MTRRRTRTALAALADVVAQEPAVTRADVEAISRRVVASVPLRSDPAAYTRFVVDSAISRYGSDGLDAVVARYSRPESVEGQWYVFIVDDNDTVVGHYNPNLLGLDLKGPAGTDANGYNFGAEMLSATGHGKWVSYVYTNAAAGGVGSERFGASQLKNAWVVRHGGRCRLGALRGLAAQERVGGPPRRAAVRLGLVHRHRRVHRVPGGDRRGQIPCDRARGHRRVLRRRRQRPGGAGEDHRLLQQRRQRRRGVVRVHRGPERR